jgi:phosphoglycan beta-1,3-galactosyltransferase
VPQFLRDIRHIRSGFKDAFPEVAPAVRDAPGIYDTEECVYWGSIVDNVHLLPLRYQGGLGYMLHRRMVQATMDLTTVLSAKTVRLAVLPFSPRFQKNYEEIMFQYEDAFVGRMMRDTQGRFREVCPLQRSSTVDEAKTRVADKPQREKQMGWAGMLLHHVTPFDIYFLHRYFEAEFNVASVMGTSDLAAAKAALEVMKKSVQRDVSSRVSGYGNYIPMEWSHPANVPSSVEAEGDNVRVYNISYAERSAMTLDITYTSVTPEW